MTFWVLIAPDEPPPPARAIISTVTSPCWVHTGEIIQNRVDHQQVRSADFTTAIGGRVMHTRFVMVADGKGGQRIVELGWGTPQPRYAPAMGPSSTSYRLPGQGEVIQSQTPHLQSDGPTQIDNGRAVIRSQEWSQAQRSESGYHDIGPDPAERRAEAVPTRPVSDQAGKFESKAASSTALEVAHTPGVECMVDHTLVDLDVAAQRGWSWVRDGQLYALHACVPLLRFAEAHEREFRDYCGNVFGKDTATLTAIDSERSSIESLAFALQVRQDPEARSMKRAHRAECANAIGWFAHLCVETDRDKAVELARSRGDIAGIAVLYSKHKDEKDPSRQERAAKAKAARSAAKIESLAVATAVSLARSVVNSVDHHEITRLKAYLKDVVGIHPVVNVGVPTPDQEMGVLLQVGDTIFGPIRDKSISATVVAQLVTEHLQQELPQDGLATTNTV
jgi:hypothetical protein